MMKTLDMRGQPCPVPVVNARKALAEDGAKGVAVLVDNFVAVQNLEKMALGTGRAFSYDKDGADGQTYRVSIVNGADSPAASDPGDGTKRPVEAREADATRGPVVLITADGMGRGAEDLGRLLIKGFIFSLTQLDPAPEAVVFLNGGALLTAKGSNTVPDLITLAENGSKILTCGTCANYYKTAETLAVGDIVDMMAITNLLANAAGAITI